YGCAGDVNNSVHRRLSAQRRRVSARGYLRGLESGAITRTSGLRQTGLPRFRSDGSVAAPVTAPAPPPTSAHTTAPGGPARAPTPAPVAAPAAAPPWTRSRSSVPHAPSIATAPTAATIMSLFTRSSL